MNCEGAKNAEDIAGMSHSRVGSDDDAREAFGSSAMVDSAIWLKRKVR